MARRRSPTLELMLLLQEHYGDFTWIPHKQITHSARIRNIQHGNPLAKLTRLGIVEKRKKGKDRFSTSYYRLSVPVAEATDNYKNYLNGVDTRRMIVGEGEQVNPREVI